MSIQPEPTLGNLFQRNEDLDSHKNLYMDVYSNIIHKGPNWKPPESPTMGESIHKLWCIQTRKHYSAMKRNELLIHTTTWINCERITLSEKCQSQKVTYCTIPFCITFLKWQNGEHISHCQGWQQRREVDMVIKGFYEGSLWWWNCSVS